MVAYSVLSKEYLHVPNHEQDEMVFNLDFDGAKPKQGSNVGVFQRLAHFPWDRRGTNDIIQSKTNNSMLGLSMFGYNDASTHTHILIVNPLGRWNKLPLQTWEHEKIIRWFL